MNIILGKFIFCSTPPTGWKKLLLNRSIVSTVLRRGLCVFLALLFLSACQSNLKDKQALDAQAALLHKQRIMDFSQFPCDQIWIADDDVTTVNPLFWLRMIECSKQLTPTTAREKMQTFIVVSWSSAFKRGILSSKARPTPIERNEQVTEFTRYHTMIPSSLRTLTSLWYAQQKEQLQALNDKKRYQQTLTNSETKLKELKEREIQLTLQLAEKNKKLASLTDIERQLSSRKQLQNDLSPDGEKTKAVEENSAPAHEQPLSQPAQLPDPAVVEPEKDGE